MYIYLLQLSAQSEMIVSLRNAAENGDIKAQMYFGKIYSEGLYCTAKSMQQAYQWYLAAAKQGESEAQFKVSCLFMDNDKVETLTRELKFEELQRWLK